MPCMLASRQLDACDAYLVCTNKWMYFHVRSLSFSIHYQFPFPISCSNSATLGLHHDFARKGWAAVPWDFIVIQTLRSQLSSKLWKDTQHSPKSFILSKYPQSQQHESPIDIVHLWAFGHPMWPRFLLTRKTLWLFPERRKQSSHARKEKNRIPISNEKRPFSKSR